MERLHGRWLLYLRFRAGGQPRVLHVLCDTELDIDRVLGVATGPASGVHLIEHAAWSSPHTIYTRLAGVEVDRDILTYDAFMTVFGDAPSADKPAG
jgi:hypothetical protein